MIAFTREMDADGAPVFGTKTVPIAKVANAVRSVPRAWITPDGMNVTQAFIGYALPLIQGELDAFWENGVPQHLHL